MRNFNNHFREVLHYIVQEPNRYLAKNSWGSIFSQFDEFCLFRTTPTLRMKYYSIWSNAKYQLLSNFVEPSKRTTIIWPNACVEVSTLSPMMKSKRLKAWHEGLVNPSFGRPGLRGQPFPGRIFGQCWWSFFRLSWWFEMRINFHDFGEILIDFDRSFLRSQLVQVLLRHGCIFVCDFENNYFF